MVITGRIDSTERDGDGNVHVLTLNVQLPNGEVEVLHALLAPQSRARATALVKEYPDSNKLRLLRVERGMSQVELARLAGVSQAQVCHWEAGTNQPLVRNAISLARALDVSVASLQLGVYGVEQPPVRAEVA